MPDWLFEGLWQVYAVLGLTALVLLILWWRDRRRFWLYGVAMASGLALVYLLLDFAVETDGEQIGHNLQAISKAVHDRDLNKAFSFVADDFTFQGMDKKALQTLAAPYVRNGDLTGVVFWDCRVSGKTRDSPPVANVEFRVKVKGRPGTTEPFYFCRAEFRKEADGVWRLRRAQLFNPVQIDEPAPIGP